MSNAKLSVIIPCYNSANMVEDTLRSLEASSKVLYEVICINDGSKDNTLDILEAYAKNTELNMKIIDSENFGVSVARNKGIEVSGGNVLLFLDSDDKFSPLFFRGIMENYDDFDTVYGYCTRDERKLSKGEDGIQASEKDILDIQTEFMVKKESFYLATFSYKKDIIDKFNLRFTPGVKYGEDWEFTTKYLSLCGGGLFLNRQIFFYRDSEGSTIKKATYDHVHAIHAAERAEEFLLKNGSDFYSAFASYMRHRTIFSVAHNFSKFKTKELFDKLLKEYPVKKAMRAMLKNEYTSVKVKMAALSYLISKRIFFYVVGRM